MVGERKALKERVLGSKILSGIYIILIIIVYSFISTYIYTTQDRTNESIQSLILVLITSFLGTYSKQFYESMVYMIFNFEVDLIPYEVNRMMLKSFAMTNWLTILLLSAFFSHVLKGHLNVITLIAIICIPSFLYIVALFFKFLERN